MSVADDFLVNADFTPGTVAATRNQRPTTDRCTKPESEPAGETDDQPTVRHRIARVRQQQGISVRSAARRMGVPMEQVRREENPENDLTLSQVARWQRALEVPMADLLVDNDSPISAPVLKRAKWLRLMKTAKAIIELDASPAATRMATMMENQITELMPELSDVSAWHTVGQRRTQDEMGRIVDTVVPTTFASDGLG